MDRNGDTIPILSSALLSVSAVVTQSTLEKRLIAAGTTRPDVLSKRLTSASPSTAEKRLAQLEIFPFTTHPFQVVTDSCPGMLRRTMVDAKGTTTKQVYRELASTVSYLRF